MRPGPNSLPRQRTSAPVSSANMGRQERFVAFGPEDAPLNFVQAVLKVAGHNWVDDQHSRSTWPMHYTGYLTTSLPKLQRPEGRIRLAGSDFANGWGGFIDGAIESGLDAARAVGEQLVAPATANTITNPARQPVPAL